MYFWKYMDEYKVTQPEMADLMESSVTHMSRLATGLETSTKLGLKAEWLSRGDIGFFEMVYADDSNFVETHRQRRMDWLDIFYADDIKAHEHKAA